MTSLGSLYNAVRHQLTVQPGLGAEAVPALEALRGSVADHLGAHMDDFLPFLADTDTGELMTGRRLIGIFSSFRIERKSCCCSSCFG